MSFVRISPEVERALRDGRPVVALETAVVTHGLPREPMRTPACAAEYLARSGHVWNERGPANVELARAVGAVVRSEHATPATVGVVRGQIVIGMSENELALLGASHAARKLSARDLAIAQVRGEDGGTTVAGTLAALARAGDALPRPIRIFATGGIGGIHRGWTERPDVSADLLGLARARVALVSAGAKSILDVPATVEALDSLGVPVLGLATRWFPQFYSAGAPPLAVQCEVADLREAATVCAAHWRAESAGGVLLANPPPARWALPQADVERAIADGCARARDAGIASADLTPYLLAHVAGATAGRSVEANVALLFDNARVAARLAAVLESLSAAAGSRVSEGKSTDATP